MYFTERSMVIMMYYIAKVSMINQRDFLDKVGKFTL